VADAMGATDSELMVAAKDLRTAEAFDELWSRYAPQLLKYVSRLTANRDLAEDLVQETFLRVFQRRAQWTGAVDQFRPWLFAIARNAAIDWLRKRDADAILDPALEKELRCLARRASQFLEARLAAIVDLVVDHLHAACVMSAYRGAHRNWLSLHVDHPPRNLFQAAVWSVQFSGRCVPGQA
jgi:RNA polymerase sigma factor (sigma-70 family)